jgi:uncharacterized protein YndB with AHSA1/START domain
MTMQAVSVEPVRRTVTVGRSVEEAFALFTEGISTWWPFPSHSIGGADTVAAVFKPESGRLYEVLADGTEHDWADIIEWSPPERFVLAWHPNPERRTEVEVRFIAAGEGTRVELEHRGWERLGAVAHEARASYVSGWTLILGKYGAAA